MSTNELLLKTAFCCMACDGEIANEEISLVKNLATEANLFSGIDVETLLNDYVHTINEIGVTFLSNYLEEVSSANLSDEESLKLIDIAFRIIEADNNVKYSEISFFKRIRGRLTISDGAIEAAFANKEDLENFLLPDIIVHEKEYFDASFKDINLK